jgi:hypothetical protein
MKHAGEEEAYFVSVKRMEVSILVFQLSSERLLAALRWYINTAGVFQLPLNANASAVETLRTEKSLKRCHLLSG